MEDPPCASDEIVLIGSNRKRSSSDSCSPEPKCAKRQHTTCHSGAATMASISAGSTATGLVPEEEQWSGPRMDQDNDATSDDATTLGIVNCLRRIVLSDDPLVITDAWNRLEAVKYLKPDNQHVPRNCNWHYNKFFRDLLSDNRTKNIIEIPRLLQWFSNFSFSTTDSSSDDIANFLNASARDFKKQPFLAEILQVLSDNYAKYLSPHENHADLWKAIVEALSWYKVPQDSSEVDKYNKDLNIVLQFLTCEAGENSSVLVCFDKLCEILLARNRKEKPSSALIIILQLIDCNLWTDYMGIVVDHILTEYKESRVVKMLILFCHWLVQPYFSHVAYLSTWLALFVKYLMHLNKNRLITNVADVALPELFSKYARLQLFNDLETHDNVIFYLIPYLSSLKLMHKIIKFIIGYINNTELMVTNDVDLRRYFIEIVKTVLKKFQRHFENKSCTVCNSVKRVIEYYEENGEFSVTSTGLEKMNTGKMGLRNLGNTCYMNSVLQALVMTRQFCREVLLYKSANNLSDQTVLKNLQNLFALLKYSEKLHLVPTEILQSSIPAYFDPGEQQDSSEFLCHLLDITYEQEKSALTKSSNSHQNLNLDSELVVKEVEETTRVEESVSEGEDLAQAQAQHGLLDSYSDSADSGIQSVGGENTISSCSAISASSLLVQRVFGGKLKVTYRCMQCGTESHNTDQFRDLQLCFLEVNTTPSKKSVIKVQDLINSNYLMPENLTGENKYHCEQCAGLCDAQRIIKILQAPAHLILTLKHFRYDPERGLRIKLRRKVVYDEKIELPVLNQANETYQLYAAVVHSGYSMDYGHYITYACDAQNRWYMFNDSFVSHTTLEEFKNLEPPDTPYILFYRRCGSDNEPVEDAPDFASLTKSLQDYVEQEKQSVARNKSKIYHREDEDIEDNKQED